MLGALDTPYHIKRARIETRPLGVQTLESCMPVNPRASRRHRTPTLLNTAQSITHHFTTQPPCQMDRGATHATTYVQYPLTTLDLRQVDQLIHKVLLRSHWRFVRAPQTMMQMAAP